MKVVILAGGYGSRISEESDLKPKPMIEIGGMPILWHIMKIYSYYGFDEFIICAGYKQHIIKQWFSDYFLYTSDVTFDFTKESDQLIVHDKRTEKWKVSIIDTGLDTMTGGRIKRIQKYIGDETFMLTYGDAVGNVDLTDLIKTHRKCAKIGTMSVYNFGQAKGVVELNKDGSIEAFREKADRDGDLINIGFMVLEPEVFNYLENDETVFEKTAINNLIQNHSMAAYVHKGYWQCMDTLREKHQLEKLWTLGKAPWKLWDN